MRPQPKYTMNKKYGNRRKYWLTALEDNYNVYMTKRYINRYIRKQFNKIKKALLTGSHSMDIYVGLDIITIPVSNGIISHKKLVDELIKELEWQGYEPTILQSVPNSYIRYRIELY